jgi:hypothetical protein
MLGTRTLVGTQEKNIFVDESGRKFHIINDWVPPKMRIKKFILIRKYDDNSWYLMRDLIIDITYLD